MYQWKKFYTKWLYSLGGPYRNPFTVFFRAWCQFWLAKTKVKLWNDSSVYIRWWNVAFIYQFRLVSMIVSLPITISNWRRFNFDHWVSAGCGIDENSARDSWYVPKLSIFCLLQYGHVDDLRNWERVRTTTYSFSMRYRNGPIHDQSSINNVPRLRQVYVLLTSCWSQL